LANAKLAVGGKWLGAAIGIVLVDAELARLAASGPTLRLALVACLLVLVLGVWALKPTSLLLLLVAWTVALGSLRRILSYEFVGSAAGADPLLLIQPFVLVLLASLAVRSGALQSRTRLANGVLALTIFTVLGSVNPLQGSLGAGIAALIFFVPLIGFWIGRVIDDATLRRALVIAGVLALPVALYGFAQLAYGFPHWDAAWIVDQGYGALNVSHVIRPFSSFSSASEYAGFLAVGIIIWSWLEPGRLVLPIRLTAAAVLLVALFYESSRGIVFALVATVGLLVAARMRLPLGGAAVFAAATLLLLPLAISNVAPPAGPAATGTGALVSHQVQGLANPTGRQSTLPGHFRLVVDGLRSALTSPLGRGISVVTVAGNKFGGTTAGTEADPSNVAVALGLPGLVAYLIIVGYGFAAAYRGARQLRTPLSFAALGILGVTFFQWLNGGQYAISFLVWLVLGWIDRSTNELDREPHSVEASVT
jgi:hypothetical protein